jgi:hypothetical protein
MWPSRFTLTNTTGSVSAQSVSPTRSPVSPHTTTERGVAYPQRLEKGLKLDSSSARAAQAALRIVMLGGLSSPGEIFHSLPVCMLIAKMHEVLRFEVELILGNPGPVSCVGAASHELKKHGWMSRSGTPTRPTLEIPSCPSRRQHISREHFRSTTRLRETKCFLQRPPSAQAWPKPL